MQNKISELVSNMLELDENLVWVLDKTRKFGYSDGVESEQYLRKVLSESSDLSSNSYELETYIKDWNSEYHLSRKRAQLLKGFSYDRSKKVLEVGCGCGAMTRFLGETFDNVTAIEGSIARAGIARMRTKELDNVSIVCAPFQEIRFKKKFDIIFCIGVFEYSNMFVNASDPYDHILKYFNEILNPGGEVVIAIENQFGLKYFSSSTEDHSAVMFDGIEGYTRFANKNARTFGYTQLSSLLKRHFNSVDYYFPFPDYKMPSCLVSEEFLNKASLSELVGGFKQTNYLEQPKPLFDERLTLSELDKNKMLTFFSNSFLVFAGKDYNLSSKMMNLGMVYSHGRLQKFQTITTFKEENEKIIADKKLQCGYPAVNSEFVSLHECKSTWIDGKSLHSELLHHVKERGLSIEELFSPVKIWAEKLRSLSYESDGRLFLDGKYVDCIWKNSFLVNENCEFIDLEWEWNKPITIHRLLIKSIVEFINDISDMTDVNPILKIHSKKTLIVKIGESLGFLLSESDFDEFFQSEHDFTKIVYGEPRFLWKFYFKLDLLDSRAIPFLRYGRNLLRKIFARLTRIFDIKLS
uniref:class I SAM-dependent methyltransferase n=1 Tax=Algoriphagus sp. TaxID=1872435 RepID=UPI004047136F